MFWEPSSPDYLYLSFGDSASAGSHPLSAGCGLVFPLQNQVTEQMKLLKHLYLAVSNLPSDEQAVELPEDLTAEKMVTVVTAFFKASNNVIEAVVQELLAKVRCTF